ncbi:uncharacterized protein [Drosophila tropicalis]|uniref:uncharacterized protein n=1 Tax=Drosophila tropicalis TaxID=46794 RepID=UPI0035ABA54C
MLSPMSFLWLFGLCTLLLGCLGDIFEECNESNNGMYIASSKSCAHYIACEGEDSFEGECGEGDYFNAQDQVCELMLDMDCRTGSAVQAEPESEPIEGRPEQEVVVQNTTLLPTSIAVSTQSSAISPAPSNALPSNIISTATPSVIVVATVCPTQDKLNQIVLLPNPNSCTDYFICYHGQTQVMSCSPQLHFNPSTGKCDRPENAKCLATNIGAREQCKAHVVDVYPHLDNCNYFYNCNKGYLMVQQCPFSFGWDYEKRSCMEINHAKCYNSRSRV